MLVQGIMTKNVVTVSPNTSVGEAKKIMREHNFHRLPVVANGRLVGLVTEASLERVQPRVAAPRLSQITYLISLDTVSYVMRKRGVTTKPT